MGNLPSRERQIGFHGRRERGFALYLIFLILGAAALITIASSISPTSVNSRDQAVRAAILSEARQALVGWAITRGSTSSPGTDRPGDLPAPDTASEATPNYDGDRDTGCMDGTKTTGLPLISNSVNVRCLGRLPWRDLKLALQPPAERDQNNNAKVGEQDVEGKMPWYAVSANLTRIDNCLSMLNPETVNLPYAGFNCGSSSNVPYPWLTVRDSNGNIISDRVAFVVILPGPVIGSQQRNAAPNLGGASQYLDDLTVSSGCSAPCVPGNYSNSDLDNDFIAGDESGSFNDRLVYMTIDDLMAAVENQVASNIAAALKTAATETYTEDPKSTSNAGTPRYFWLAPFNPAGTAYQPAAISTYRGMLPGHAIGDSVSTGFQWSMSAGTPVSISGSTVTAGEVRNYTVPAESGSCTWNTSLSVTTENLIRTVNCSGTQWYPKSGVTVRLVSLSYTGSTTTTQISTNPLAGNLVIVPATTGSAITRSVRRSSLTGVSMYIYDFYYNPGTSSYEFVGYGTESGGSGYSIQTWGINYYPSLMSTWYYNNDWHRFVYIAMSTGYLPGGGNSCGGSCFTVRLNGKVISSNNIGVVLNSGKTLSGQSRSPHNTTLSNYFEGSNSAAGTLIFDKTVPVTSTANDHVVTIAP